VLRADKVAADATHFSFTIDQIHGGFDGVWSGEGNGWAGTWKQGSSLPLVLTRMASRSAAMAPAKRPQEEAIAVGRRPCRQEAASFGDAAANIRPAGTLSIPDGAGPFPAADLISGSGPQTRDEEVFGRKVFRVLADALVDDSGHANRIGLGHIESLTVLQGSACPGADDRSRLRGDSG